MRLVCPRCGAQYEIDAAAIPAAGRDVECSACDHVWRAWPAPEPAEPFDPTARPRLSRPLSESVIEILRQEAARELEVRAAERRSQRLAEAGVVEAGVAETGLAETPPSDTAPAPAADTPSPDDTLLPGDAPEAEPGDHGEASETVPATTAGPSAAPSAPSPPAVRATGDAVSSAPTQAAWRRRRYDAGFHLAVMLALVALALYALAPRLGDQQPFGPVLLEWRGKVDHARDRLSAQGDAAIARLRAVIDGSRAD